MKTAMVDPNNPCDPANTREKILLTALKLFAEQGFERTTVRQIVKEAEVNISAISYYFGDKSGLYKAAYMEPMGCPTEDISLFDNPELSLEDAFFGVFSGFIAPLKQGELAKQCMRLHMREMVEPTGIWTEMIDNEITPHHLALLQVLKRQLSLNEVDDDLHRLATCIVAMGVILFAGRDVLEKTCPQIIDTDQALDTTHERMVTYAVSMVDAERIRRKIEKNAHKTK